MFSEVMKKGVLFMPEPHFFPGAAPYWFFLFDYAPFLRTFAAPGRRLFLHDYADRTPYPGWRMIDRLGIGGALMAQPSDEDSNHRMSREQVHANFLARMSEAVGDQALDRTRVGQGKRV